MRHALLIAGVLGWVGCAGQPVPGTLPTRGRAPSVGEKAAFADALAQMKAGRCEDAVQAFDRVATRHADGRYVSASLYNAGLCLQRLGRWADSAERFEQLLSVRPSSRDVTHARFQLAFLYNETQRFEDALEVVDGLLTDPSLTSDERSELLARRAEAQLGLGDLPAAAEAAKDALRFFRTRRPPDHVRDAFFAASAAFTLAETIRLRSEAIDIPLAEVEAQHAVLERRAALLLQAQRAYFDAIRLTDAYWASAAGYRIGAMYEELWHAIMAAPVPPPKTRMRSAELAIYRREYRFRLAELARPLMRHAIRY